MKRFLLVGCAALVLLAGAGSARAASVSTWLDGVWRTDGYGMVVTVSQGHAQVYQTTGISCLPADAVDQVGAVGPDRVVRFGAGGVVLATVRPQGRDRARLHTFGTGEDIMLRRMPALPARCTRPTATDPVTSFDIFWRTFAENYPLFAAKGIDWAAVRARYRPQVSAATSDAQLFGIFVDMLRPLGDAHTYVAIDRGHNFEGLRPGTRRTSEALGARVQAAVDAYLGVPVQSWGAGHLGYADLPGGVGYLRITSFGGYTDADTYQADTAELDRALDAVFTPARTGSLRGLIVDVRFNVGGDDPLGIQVAQRLTGKPYLAFTTRARNDPDDPARHTRPQPVVVHPRGPVYTGPVALLTSDLTVSAGETFTEAMLGRDPRPVRIGAATQGVFFDELNRTLPNGWRFGLPNGQTLTPDGRSFDGVGIAPDVSVPVFTDDELNNHRDSAIDAARRLLADPGTPPRGR